jgi:hypothetical protein
MTTAAEVQQAYSDVNGSAAAVEVPNEVYEAAAHYATMNGYDISGSVVSLAEVSPILLALDVLRLAFDGEFDGLSPCGDERCWKE